MMGGKFSKKNDGDSSQSPSQALPPLQLSKNPMFSNHLRSYEAACVLDSRLQSFDAVLRERTNHVFRMLETGVEVRSMSFDSLKEVTVSLLDVDQEVVKIILENKDDVRSNKDMFALVNLYFDNSMKTLEFCNSLEKCLKHASRNQLVVRAAISQFEEELRTGSADDASFDKTLRMLEKFKETADPFTNEFFAMFQSVLVNQYEMLEKLASQKGMLDKKLRSVKTWKRVSNVIFVTVFVAVLICSVVAAAIAAPPVVTALLGALAVPIGSVGKWCSSLWDRYTKTVRGDRELFVSMQVLTKLTLAELDNTRALVHKLADEIQSLVDCADLGLTEEGSLKIVMEAIKKNVEEFSETVEILGKQNCKCIEQIASARRVVVGKIVKHSSSEEQ